MRTRRSILLTAMLPLLATVASVTTAAAESHLDVIFLDAGHGDTALYRGPCGEIGLVDAAEGAADEVLAQLDAWDARDDLRWVSVSHYDDEHLGDVIDVATAPGVSVEAVYDRGGDRAAADTGTYRDYFDWVTAAGVRQPVDIGASFELCGTVTFDVVSAGTDGTAAGEVTVSRENDRSVCLAVAHGEFDLASCGDVDQQVEMAVAPAIGDVEVVKVSHHGSASSSSPEYVTTLAAEAAVVTAGANAYGHPVQDVVDRWSVSGAVMFQTGNPDGSGRDGDVTISAAADGTFLAAGQTGRAFDSGAEPQRSIDAACMHAPRERFADVPTSNVHAYSIDCISWWGVALGVEPGLFAPGRALPRSQMATFVARAIDLSGGSLPASTPDAFFDDDGLTHEPSINQLAALRVVAGLAPGIYDPARTVNRAQMATYLVNSWEARTGHRLPAGPDVFTDDDGSTHEDNINRASAAGLTAGVSATTYAPGATLTRQQMSTFIARLLAKLVEDGHTTYPPT